MKHDFPSIAQFLAPLFLLFAPALSAQDLEPLASCDCHPVHMDDAFCTSDMVFEGVPLTMDTVFAKRAMGRSKKNIDHVNVHFRVVRTWKGPGTPAAVVTTFYKREECAYPFSIGKRYLVFASGVGGMIVTDRCTPTCGMGEVDPEFRERLSCVQANER